MIDVFLDTFNGAQEKLPPNPTKPHYLFNIRDIWKVFLRV